MESAPERAQRHKIHFSFNIFTSFTFTIDEDEDDDATIISYLRDAVVAGHIFWYFYDVKKLTVASCSFRRRSPTHAMHTKYDYLVGLSTILKLVSGHFGARRGRSQAIKVLHARTSTRLPEQIFFCLLFLSFARPLPFLFYYFGCHRRHDALSDRKRETGRRRETMCLEVFFFLVIVDAVVLVAFCECDCRGQLTFVTWLDEHNQIVVSIAQQ